MLVKKILRWPLLLIELVIAAPVLYLCIVSISAIVATKRSRKEVKPSSEAPFDFAFLIPAHNEEILLGNLLSSLANLNYSKDRYAVYVVADNCTDTTAEIARATGWVHVYERFDAKKRGKGFALNWLLQKLKEDHVLYDACVIVDADSVVEANFLQEMSKGLAEGAQALQARYNVLNLSESPSAALRWSALTLMCHVRPLGRNGLGGSSTLTGNGMCFRRSLLERYPWQAFSIAEDYEYYLSLIEQGVRVRYVPDAIVHSPMPTTFEEMRTQDIRWEASNPSRSKLNVTLSLLKGGFRSRDFARIEAVAEYLTPPLSFLACCTLLTFIVSLLIGTIPEILFGFLLVSGLVGYVGTGPFLLRPPAAIYRALLYSPVFMLWKVWVYLVLRRSKRHRSEWVRTSRPAQKVSIK